MHFLQCPTRLLSVFYHYIKCSRLKSIHNVPGPAVWTQVYLTAVFQVSPGCGHAADSAGVSEPLPSSFRSLAEFTSDLLVFVD